MSSTRVVLSLFRQRQREALERLSEFTAGCQGADRRIRSALQIEYEIWDRAGDLLASAIEEEARATEAQT